MTVKITLKNDTGRSAPGWAGRDFKAGEKVDIGFIPNWQGHPREGVTDLSELSFWTGADCDHALIFDPEDITLLEISSDDYRLPWLLAIWPDGPIEVKPPLWWRDEVTP